MVQELKTVTQFCANSPFTENQIRWLIFNADTNGLSAAGVIVRIGRRVYIDTRNFDRWIDQGRSGHE